MDSNPLKKEREERLNRLEKQFPAFFDCARILYKREKYHFVSDYDVDTLQNIYQKEEISYILYLLSRSRKILMANDKKAYILADEDDLNSLQKEDLYSLFVDRQMDLCRQNQVIDLNSLHSLQDLANILNADSSDYTKARTFARQETEDRVADVWETETLKDPVPELAEIKEEPKTSKSENVISRILECRQIIEESEDLLIPRILTANSDQEKLGFIKAHLRKIFREPIELEGKEYMYCELPAFLSEHIFDNEAIFSDLHITNEKEAIRFCNASPFTVNLLLYYQYRLEERNGMENLLLSNLEAYIASRLPTDTFKNRMPEKSKDTNKSALSKLVYLKEILKAYQSYFNKVFSAVDNILAAKDPSSKAMTLKQITDRKEDPSFVFYREANYLYKYATLSNLPEDIHTAYRAAFLLRHTLMELSIQRNSYSSEDIRKEMLECRQLEMFFAKMLSQSPLMDIEEKESVNDLYLHILEEEASYSSRDTLRDLMDQRTVIISEYAVSKDINKTKQVNQHYLRTLIHKLSSLERCISLKEDLTKEFEDYPVSLSQLVIEKLACAEYLYNFYIEGKEENSSLDYSCISALYFSAFEDALNELLYQRYIRIINNHAEIRENVLVRKENPSRIEGYGYFPEGKEKYRIYTEVVSGNIRDCIDYTDLVYLLEVVLNPERQEEVRQFINYLDIIHVDFALLPDFVLGLLSIREAFDKAVKGLSEIRYSQVLSDKESIYSAKISDIKTKDLLTKLMHLFKPSEN